MSDMGSPSIDTPTFVICGKSKLIEKILFTWVVAEEKL